MLLLQAAGGESLLVITSQCFLVGRTPQPFHYLMLRISERDKRLGLLLLLLLLASLDEREIRETRLSDSYSQTGV
jgi:hypothetical protein